jgi:hypothetical protein
MTDWQRFFLLGFAVFSLFAFFKALHECRNKRNAFGLTPWLLPIGAFVWGDAVVFGFFWAVISLAAGLMQDWYLFLLITSLFWVTRGFGEMIYWFNQQFSTLDRNPPEKMKGYEIFRNDSVWFVYQIVWQCVTVIALLLSLYFAFRWLGTL